MGRCSTLDQFLACDAVASEPLDDSIPDLQNQNCICADQACAAGSSNRLDGQDLGGSSQGLQVCFNLDSLPLNIQTDVCDAKHWHTPLSQGIRLGCSLKHHFSTGTSRGTPLHSFCLTKQSSRDQPLLSHCLTGFLISMMDRSSSSCSVPIRKPFTAPLLPIG